MKRSLAALMMLIALSTSALSLSGCVVAPRRPPGCFWVRGHWTGPPPQHWVPRHCRR